MIFSCILSGVCLPGWSLNSGNCRCYKFLTKPATWTEANSECQRIAPTNPRDRPPVTARHLAAPQSKPENDFLANLTGGKNAWIGGFKFADGKWGWTDGQQWNEEKTFWNKNEPNNFGGRENSLLLNWGGRGGWNDSPFQNRYPYVCQYLDLQSGCKRSS